MLHCPSASIVIFPGLFIIQRQSQRKRAISENGQRDPRRATTTLQPFCDRAVTSVEIKPRKKCTNITANDRNRVFPRKRCILCIFCPRKSCRENRAHFGWWGIGTDAMLLHKSAQEMMLQCSEIRSFFTRRVRVERLNIMFLKPKLVLGLLTLKQI